jgi:hypothetical protein
MSNAIEPRNELSSEELIDDYLRRERTSQALRLTWVGGAIALSGGVASWFVWRWVVDGGVLFRPMLAGPFALLAGVPIAAYGLVLLVRANRS